jgi:hypothetical protein
MHAFSMVRAAHRRFITWVTCHDGGGAAVHFRPDFEDYHVKLSGELNQDRNKDIPFAAASVAKGRRRDAEQGGGDQHQPVCRNGGRGEGFRASNRKVFPGSEGSSGF